MKNDREVRLMRRERAKGRNQEVAAARTGMSVRTLRKYERAGKLPSQVKQPHTWQTRANPFIHDWPWVVGELERDPALQANTLFEVREAAASWALCARAVAHASRDISLPGVACTVPSVK